MLEIIILVLITLAYVFAGICVINFCYHIPSLTELKGKGVWYSIMLYVIAVVTILVLLGSALGIWIAPLINLIK